MWSKKKNNIKVQQVPFKCLVTKLEMHIFYAQWPVHRK